MIDYLVLEKDNLNEIYQQLKQIKQDTFPDNYRLVVKYNADIINNDQYAGAYLSEFIKILYEIDFPTFFVIVETAYENITRDLTQLNNVYKIGSPTTVFANNKFKVINTKVDSFCVLPWMHFYFNPQGQINACCEANNNYPLGNFQQTINFNSKPIVDFRQTLIENKPAPQCSMCYQKEKNNLPSQRQELNHFFSKYIPETPTAIVKDFKLRYLDIRLSNVCNLQCRMCSGKFSSRIATEDYKIWGYSEFLHNSNSNKYESKIFELIKQHIDSIERIYFAGGEPLLSEFHYNVLDLLIEHNRTDIQIAYNTNFSLIDRVLDYWSKFSNISVGASIDLIGSASNYVRNGVEYSKLESNYFKLIKNLPSVKFEITSVLSLYNIFNLCNLQQHWINNIKLPPKSISFNVLTTPENMSIRVLPTKYKKIAEENITKHQHFLSDKNAKHLITQWDKAIEFMNGQDNSHLLKSFFEIGNLRDRARNQNFEDYFPEFQNLRNYSLE